jgi:hypothetical protein
MQESKIVALRLAGSGHEPRQDKSSILPPLCPPELVEDLRWVLRQLRAPDLTRSEPVQSDRGRRREFVWTLAATAALIATGASLWILALNKHASDGRHNLSHASASGSIASSLPASRAHGSALSEESDRREHRNTLDLPRVEEAKRVQQRLADLGFFVGTPTGIWGPRSRQALRDFKIANGLVADERWDMRTETALGNPQALSAADTFVGTWASDLAECRPAQGAGVRISPPRPSLLGP